MKEIFFYPLFLSLLFLGNPSGLFGQQFSDALANFKGSKDSTFYYLTINGSTSVEGRWLGVTVYPPFAPAGGAVAAKMAVATKKTPLTAFHHVVALKGGRFLVTLKIPLKYVGGHFEVGIWAKKTPIDPALATSALVKKLGFYLSGLLRYGKGCSLMKSGSLNNYLR